MRKPLTPEQIAKRDARRAKFKALWKQVGAMPEAERIKLADKAGIVTCDGHALSGKNQCLVILQCPGVSVVGGFRQWLKHGRAVRKGEHGAMIWVPIGGRKSTGANGETVLEGGDETHFTIGTVFDISQTEEFGQALEPWERGTDAEPTAAELAPEVAI